MHDQMIEDRLRSTLRSETDSLPLTITADELDRRLALRRRERLNDRFGLLVAGIAAVAVGTSFALAIGPFRGPDVAATPLPTVGASGPGPSTVASSGPLDPREALPVLDPSADAVDFHRSEQMADVASTDSTPEIFGVEGVRMDARHAGIRFVCSGPDVAEIIWGYPQETAADSNAIASERVMCDSVIREFRYDIAARQPLVDDSLAVVTSRRVSYRILIESFGFTNQPRPTKVPDLAIPRGTVVLDVASSPAAETGIPVGTIPARGYYRVAMVCLGTGSASWSIGKGADPTFIDRGEVACDGAPLAFVSSTGMPSGDSNVYVDTDPANGWRLVVTDPYGQQAFTPPRFEMFVGADVEGTPTSGPALCLGWDDHRDSCGLPLLARDGARVLGVQFDGDVSFVVRDAWTITDASMKVADRDDVRRYGMAANVRDFAVLGDDSGRLSVSGDRMTASVAGLEAGEWMLIVNIEAEKDGHTFGAVYELPLRVGG